MERCEEMKIIKEVEEFELKHGIISFIAIAAITIIVIRIFVLIYDPEIIIRGFKLHHFYYGVILLIITNLLMLFGNKHYRSYLTLSAISTGLILDEFIFILGNMQNTQQYYETLPSVIIFIFIITLIVEIINKRKIKK